MINKENIIIIITEMLRVLQDGSAFHVNTVSLPGTLSLCVHLSHSLGEVNFGAKSKG